MNSVAKWVNMEPVTEQPTIGDEWITDPSLEPTTGLPRLILAALEQTRSPACITTSELDPPGPKIVYVNPAYAEMTGRRREDVIGQTPRIMQGPLTDRSVLDRLRGDLASGRRFQGETVNYRADGSPFIINWSIDPVRNLAGTVTHYVATQEDVTEKVRLRNLLNAEQLLDDALTRELVETRDQTASFAAMARQIAEGAERIAGVGSARVVIRDDSTHETAEAGRAVAAGTTVDNHFSRADALVRGTVEITGLSDDELAILDRAGLQQFTARAAGVTAALAEYHRQRRVALRLQLDLLPPTDLEVDGFDLVTRYLPGSAGLRVGGDWYDAIERSGRIVFTVGDVAGSGADAAALMGRLRLLARSEVERGSDGAEVLRVLDAVCRDDDRMATVLLVEIDPVSGTTTTWSAGHLPPVVLAAGGAAARPGPVDVAPPLGHLTDVPVRPATDRLDPGASILLYTDGLLERRSESLDAGLTRLAAAFSTAEPLAAVVDRILALEGDDLADDVALLAARRR
jgi:PAS domain S-box-containing protein